VKKKPTKNIGHREKKNALQNSLNKVQGGAPNQYPANFTARPKKEKRKGKLFQNKKNHGAQLKKGKAQTSHDQARVMPRRKPTT